eukprot:124138-Pelagomonas_calceolata.AAC.2
MCAQLREKQEHSRKHGVGEGATNTLPDLAPPPHHPVRLRIRMRAYDTNLLADAVADMATIADVTGAEFKGPVMLPTRKKIYCVLRSPHVNKDAREHFEVRTHHRWVGLGFWRRGESPIGARLWPWALCHSGKVERGVASGTPTRPACFQRKAVAAPGRMPGTWARLASFNKGGCLAGHTTIG